MREARHEHPEARAVVVTMDEEDQVGSGDEIIELIPAWRWLLEESPTLTSRTRPRPGTSPTRPIEATA